MNNIDVSSESKKSVTIEEKPVTRDDLLFDFTPSSQHFINTKDNQKIQKIQTTGKSENDGSLDKEEDKNIEEVKRKLENVKQKLQDEKKQIENLKQTIEHEKRRKMLEDTQPVGVVTKTSINPTKKLENGTSQSKLKGGRSVNAHLELDGYYTISNQFKDHANPFVINVDSGNVNIPLTKQNNYSKDFTQPTAFSKGYTSFPFSNSAPTKVQHLNFVSGYYHLKHNIPKWEEIQYNSYWVPYAPPQSYNAYSYGAHSNFPVFFSSASSYNPSTYGGQMGTTPSYTLPYAPSFYNPPPLYQAHAYGKSSNGCFRHRGRPSSGSSYDTPRVSIDPTMRMDGYRNYAECNGSKCSVPKKK